MAEAILFEFSGVTKEDYYTVNELLALKSGAATWPGGLLSHAAAIGETLIIIEVWESREAQAAFFNDSLGPKLREATIPAPIRAEWLPALGYWMKSVDASSVVLLEFPGSGETEYESVLRFLNIERFGGGDWPTGMLGHVGASDGSKVVVWELWDSVESQIAALGTRLGPALGNAGVAPPARAEWFELIGFWNGETGAIYR